MKKLLLTAVVTFATFSFSANAALNTANKFKFTGDTKYASLCEAAATNNLELFKSSVRETAYSLGKSKRSMLNLLASADSFSCAGQSVAAFAQSRGATDVASYVNGDSASEGQLASSKYKFVGSSQFKSFCEAAVTDNAEMFERALSRQVGSIGASKSDVMDKVLDAEGVKCAGKGLVEFFQERGATSVINYISEKVSK
ncbi:hypothetical protein [uncultured Paraglaciecola sp.]|uniref:hypothetical protein n=1 Tax=uncultured Paraglaciecola sp. TaxID=1765024 RepID=UPI00259814FB|nr:hypothetical protein [uncultured Paraglaciecola sp.]